MWYCFIAWIRPCAHPLQSDFSCGPINPSSSNSSNNSMVNHRTHHVARIVCTPFMPAGWLVCIFWRTSTAAFSYFINSSRTSLFNRVARPRSASNPPPFPDPPAATGNRSLQAERVCVCVYVCVCVCREFRRYEWSKPEYVADVRTSRVGERVNSRYTWNDVRVSGTNHYRRVRDKRVACVAE